MNNMIKEVLEGEEHIRGILGLSEEPRLAAVSMLLSETLGLSMEASTNIMTLSPEGADGLDAFMGLGKESVELLLMGWHFCKNAAEIKAWFEEAGDDPSKVDEAVMMTSVLTSLKLTDLMDMSGKSVTASFENPFNNA